MQHIRDCRNLILPSRVCIHLHLDSERLPRRYRASYVDEDDRLRLEDAPPVDPTRPQLGLFGEGEEP